MQIILIILRVVHIVAGAFWAGSALLIALVLMPGLQKGGPAAMRAMPMANISKAMGVASVLTVLAGAVLYAWIYRFDMNWIASPIGLGFTLGTIAGIVALLVGSLHTGPAAKKVAMLGEQLQAAGAPPTPEQAAAMQNLQARVKTSSMIGTVLTTISLVLMATARYW